MAVNEQTRTQRISHALKVAGSTVETWRVPWRGAQEQMPVIRIGLDSIVLNPRSHRIKSQLESNTDAREAIEIHAESDIAQDAIASLLRLTPGFEDLKQNLHDEGQREPGIVTSDGLLVNANTRAVALREIGREYIEVAVLPADTTLGEIYDLELDLQVAQDYRQDYSFTNELLFIDDLITQQNRSDEEVARRLRWTTPTKPATVKKGVERVRRYVRHLDLIRDIQAMSGGRVPLVDFDDAEQTLQEFDTAYEALRDKDPQAAKRLKHARTLGLLVDLGYERQRSVDSAWVEDYLAEALDENELLAAMVPELAASAKGAGSAAANGDEEDPFADFDGDDDEEDTADIHLVVEELARRLGSSARDDLVKLPTSDGEKEFDRELIRSALNDAMRTAAEDSRNAAKAGTALQLPAHHAEEAAKRLAKARQAYEKVSGDPGFDPSVLKAQVDKAVRALDALTATIAD